MQTRDHDMKKYETFITAAITAPLIVVVTWICLTHGMYRELIAGMLLGIFSTLFGMKKFEGRLEARVRKAKSTINKGVKVDGRKNQRFS